MNNEETMIMMPEKSGATEQNNVNKADEAKNKKKGNGSQRVAAAVAGAAMGGVATAATVGMMNADEVEVQAEEDAQETATAAPAATTTEEPEVEVKEEENAPESFDENGDPDYTGNAGANPVTQNPSSDEPQPIPASNPTTTEDAPEVEVLGVYQNEDGQELAFLTDGETVAAVLDADGDGEVDVLAVDENVNGEFEEGEIHDVSDQHVSMQSIEQEYIAQHPEEFEQQEYYAQQDEMEQQDDTFAYNASDDYDYNNDADMFYDA